MSISEWTSLVSWNHWLVEKQKTHHEYLKIPAFISLPIGQNNPLKKTCPAVFTSTFPTSLGEPLVVLADSPPHPQRSGRCFPGGLWCVGAPHGCGMLGAQLSGSWEDPGEIMGDHRLYHHLWLFIVNVDEQTCGSTWFEHDGDKTGIYGMSNQVDDIEVFSKFSHHTCGWVKWN